MIVSGYIPTPNEPQRDGTYLHTCAPKKTQINLRIHTVWSESLLSAWRNSASSASPKYAQWRFRSDCATAQSDLNLRWTHMSECTFPDFPVQFVCKTKGDRRTTAIDDGKFTTKGKCSIQPYISFRLRWDIIYPPPPPVNTGSFVRGAE